MRETYLHLLKQCLTFSLWGARDGDLQRPPVHPLKRKVKEMLGRPVQPIDPRSPEELRFVGQDWPRLGHTMIGHKRMDNVRNCIESVLREGVPGDLIETGVWRGGATIYMRGILKAYGITDRTVWVADSFEGLPAPDADKYPADKDDPHHAIPILAVSLEEVQENFRRYGLLDDQVRFLKGWFKDTLPSAPIQELAVARLDGDMYESTMDGLTSLYPKLSPGGFLIVDDYNSVPGCRQAVTDYRQKHGITDPIETIDFGGVFWKRKG